MRPSQRREVIQHQQGVPLPTVILWGFDLRRVIGPTKPNPVTGRTLVRNAMTSEATSHIMRHLLETTCETLCPLTLVMYVCVWGGGGRTWREPRTSLFPQVLGR